MRQKLLVFQLSAEKMKALEQICAKLGIRLIPVERRSYEQTIGYLAGIPGFPRENKIFSGMAFPKEMMIFCGMDSGKIDEFLAAYNAAGLKKIDLKAIVTMTNIRWTPNQLFRELIKEHHSMNA